MPDTFIPGLDSSCLGVLKHFFYGRMAFLTPTLLFSPGFGTGSVVCCTVKIYCQLPLKKFILFIFENHIKLSMSIGRSSSDNLRSQFFPTDICGRLEYVRKLKDFYSQPSSVATYHGSAMSVVTIRCQQIIVQGPVVGNRR